MKIIKIDGFKGLFTAAFIGICIFAGFVIFPGYCAMELWNKYCVNLLNFPTLSILQGVILWAIIAVSYFILDKKGIAISFQETKGLSESEINMIMRNAGIYHKIRNISSLTSQADKFEKTKENLNQTTSKDKDESLSNIK